MSLNFRLKKLEEEILKSGDYYKQLRLMEKMAELNPDLSSPMSGESKKEYNKVFFDFINIGLASSKKRR